MFVDTILPIPLPKLLTYRVPPQHSKHITPGSRVLVPLRAQKITTGLVASIHHQTPAYPTKEIVDVLDESPIIHPVQLKFFGWLADYYLCTLGEVMLTALPNGLRLGSQSKIQLHPEADLTTISLSEEAQTLVAALTRHTDLTYTEAAVILAQKNIHTLIKSLLRQKIILLFEKVKEKYTPKKVKRVRLHEKYVQDENAFKELLVTLKSKKKQLDVLLQYEASMPIHQTKPLKTNYIDKKALLQTGISLSALQTLVKKQILVEDVAIVSRVAPHASQGQAPPTLSQAQEQARTSIVHRFKKKNTVLLHGVTASGKTAVYMHLIASVLTEGGQVLYLLPEIALTTQMVRRLQTIFGDQVGVYHSKYTNNERVEVWHSVLQGKCNFILGTRSAIFLPFNRLRLVIVDEEHETAYKQFDAMPRYHGRDAALALAHHHHAKVLLGSATPAIESYYNAQSGKYGFVALKERFGKTALPEIILTDLHVARAQKTLREDFTKTLIEALQQTLARQEQAIIFQNRRGYAPYIICAHCATVPMCTHCAVSLTYHQSYNHLRCHYCGYQTHTHPHCHACGSNQLKNVGFGTEKLEETLQLFFPEKNVQRMDLDTTRGKHSYDKLITALEQGNIDILVGTQMLTKGLDFGQVALVGVLDVDRLLYFPDFRANERCFQLLTQVSGRAGRRGRQGKVIIQTTNRKHPILQDTLQHSYAHMYARELKERRQFLYPPYVRLVKITLKHEREDWVKDAARMLAASLQQTLGHNVLGPQQPLIAKVKRQHLMDIWVKIRKDTGAKRIATKHIIAHESRRVLSSKPWKQIKVIFDVDPI